MNTTELPEMIRECVDGRTPPISPGEIRARAAMTERRVRPVPARRGGWLGAAATGVAAAGIAGALVASQAGGGTGAGTRTVLTAAMLKQVAAASQAAMTSGRAGIVTATGGSTLDQQVTFDGADWNDVSSPGRPVQVHRSSHSVSWTGERISRVVDGQAYLYPALAFKPAPHIVRQWMHINAPGAGASLNIPDPRTLLSVLSPSAGFVTDGYTTVDGVRAEHLRATAPGSVPLQPLNPLIGTEPDNPRVSALDLWVDPSDVVLKAQFTVSGPGTVPMLTAAGTQALHQYAKEHGITINPDVLQNRGALTAWADAQAAAGNAGLAGLLRQPGMVTTEHVTDPDVTVTVTFSQIGQPEDITAPAHYITAGGKG
jgi:hypothetical protein